MISHSGALSLPFRPTDVKIVHCRHHHHYHHSDDVEQQLIENQTLLFITDYDKSCIQVYDLNSTTTTLLSSLKTLSTPYYVDIQLLNNNINCSEEHDSECFEIYVTCRSNTVHKFTISHKDLLLNHSMFAAKVKIETKHQQQRTMMQLCWTSGSPKEKFGPEKFYFPRGLALVNNNDGIVSSNCAECGMGPILFVCNSGNNRIDCINVESGKIVKSFGGEKGEGNGKFDRPVGISKNGNELFIVDHNNGLVQVLTLDGQFKRQFGSKDVLNCPRGICTINNLCLITDNHRIQLFNSETGQLLQSIGSAHEKGTSTDQFSLPEGICFNEKTSEFLIADWENKRIQFFHLNSIDSIKEEE